MISQRKFYDDKKLITDVMFKRNPYVGWEDHSHVIQKEFKFKNTQELFEFCFSILTLTHAKDTQLSVLEDEQTRKNAVVSISDCSSKETLKECIEQIEMIYHKILI